MITITIESVDDGTRITCEGSEATKIEDILSECAVEAASDKLNELLKEAGIKSTHTTESVKFPA